MHSKIAVNRSHLVKNSNWPNLNVSSIVGYGNTVYAYDTVTALA